MAKFPTIEEMAQNVAEKALDEVELNGKTIREWMEIIIETASEDTISRRAAIEVIPKKQNGTGGESWMKTYRRSGHNDCVDARVTALQKLPPVTYTKINPPSDYVRQFGLIPKENATKDGTNLAEVGTDVPDINVGELISRQQAIDALCRVHEYNGRSVEAIKQLPSAQPETIYCKDCKHWMPYEWMFSEVWQSKNIADYPEDEIGCDCCDMAMKAVDFCSRAERREVTT